MTQPLKLVRDTDHLKAVLDIPFSAQQLAAITADPQVPQAIIAGAGAGKTAVMAARVVWLVGHLGVDPAKILGLTFTAKAAAELGERVRKSLKKVGDFSEYGEPTVSTYHAFAGNLISEHGLRLGIEPDLQVLADARRFQLAARVVRGHAGSLRHVSASLPNVIKSVLDLDGQMAEHLVEPDAVRAFDLTQTDAVASLEKTVKWNRTLVDTCLERDELVQLVQEYRAAKADAGVMDFSDQMAWGAQLAKLPEVRQSLEERFDVVLLDEYQDTSIAQRDLLQALFAGRPISAVGDPAQGIYGWRGAASGNLTGFLGDFPDANGEPGKLFHLDVTRRCAPEIIDLAGYVARDYYASVANVVTALKAAAENKSGQVSVALHDTIEAEVQAVVDQVQAAIDRGTERKKIAVLVRTTNENAELVRQLRERGIPVEIVGLTGLLNQPEVVDVLSVLAILDDVTANPQMLRLLTGARWRIGDRDLALLGKRAVELGRVWTERAEESTDPKVRLQQALDQATAGVDPTEVISLAEAIESPGQLAYSAEALARFEQFAKMLQRLRRHAHEPLLDLARRVVTELDLDVELPVAGIGTDNLNLLLDAIGDFAQNDRFASLPGLLAYLDAEREFNNAMELSAPTEADSVKLLTIHKAKGLEFDEVFVPFVSKSVFPSGRGRSRWISSAAELPGPLRGDRDSVPQISGWGTKDETAYTAEMRDDSTMEETRLAYVAFTRAKYRLHVSGHWWGRTQLKARGPSSFLTDVRTWLADRGIDPVCWASGPDPDESNPHLGQEAASWPVVLTANHGRAALAAAVNAGAKSEPAIEILPELQALRAELDQLIEEAKSRAEADLVVDLGSTTSASSLLALADDEEAFARQLARPMPRKPSPAARFGTKFHAWVEAKYGLQTLLDPDELPGRGDSEVIDDSDLAELKAAFESGPFASAEPVGVEVPFNLRLGAQLVPGRIDAVFATETGFEVVDWKTNRKPDANELQLAIYRLAWAELMGLELSQVTGAFYYVRLGVVQRFDNLPDRAELERLFGLR